MKLLLSRHRLGLLALLFCLAPPAETPAAARTAPVAPELEAGFHSLYNLQFEAAQRQFRTYQQDNPGDPAGFAAEAAGLAFQEFHRLGLLGSGNFLGSNAQARAQAEAGEPRLKPDERLRGRLRAALAKTQELAGQRLQKNPRDEEALFSLTLTSGLNADYTYLVEKRGWASLKYARESDLTAHRLLELNPNYYDAYLPLGAFNYIVACLPMHERFFLRLAGISADKRRAFEQMESVAGHGGLLKPFAKILLALMCLREQEPARARRLLLELQEEFPLNSIFPRELALLDRSGPPRGVNHGP